MLSASFRPDDTAKAAEAAGYRSITATDQATGLQLQQSLLRGLGPRLTLDLRDARLLHTETFGELLL